MTHCGAGASDQTPNRILSATTFAIALFSLVSTATLAQTIPALSRVQAQSVEAGGGNPAEQATYVLNCVQEPACGVALYQVWDKNGGEFAMGKYVPSADKIPPLFRGTEVARKLRELGAVNNCNQKDPCRVFLVDAVKQLRTVPPDDLKTMYEGQAKLDWENVAERSGTQIERNLGQALASAPAVQTSAQRTAEAREIVQEAPGRVADFARDPISGVIYQIAINAAGNRELQRRNPSTGDGVELLATISGREGKWLIEPTLPGQAPFDAIDIQLTARGFVAGTRSKSRAYEGARGWSAYQWPQGFEPAVIQRGDVADTGYLLMERQGQPAGGQAGAAIVNIAYLLGAAKRDDYVLLDLHSGRTFPINVSTGGKQVSTPYNCRAKNKLVNVCKDLDVRESLIGSLGTKNIQHYAWAVNWYRTPTGTYLLALEDGGRNATVTLLEQNDRRVAFNRALGYADFGTKISDERKLSMMVNAAFQTEVIDNLVERFPSLPAATPRT
jgi:hypothetical protein